MKPASSKQKSARHKERMPDQDSAAGPNSLAIAPPSYGIDAVDNQVIQAVAKPVQAPENRTGLPAELKDGVETLSGLSMDDVRVHYNSSQPAQLQALAYTQGTDIHVAPGQEKHLAHEAWHVVQQKQGRVKATVQMKGKVNVNDDASLEKEADEMGAKAIKMCRAEKSAFAFPIHLDHESDPSGSSAPSSVRFNRQGRNHSHSDDGLPARDRGTIQGFFVSRFDSNDGSRVPISDRDTERGIAPGNMDVPAVESLREAVQEVKDGLAEIKIINDKMSIDATDGTTWNIKLNYGEKWEKVEDALNEREKDLLYKTRPFSGISRAVYDDLEGTDREDTGVYKTATRVVQPPEENKFDIHDTKNGDLDVKVTKNQIHSTIKHNRPWQKGSRSPSQSSTMFGMNAKTYVGYAKGKFEWLHLIGSSLGGPNILGNLVAGTYDANTEMIPLENRLASWHHKLPKDGSKEVGFEVFAELVPGTWAAKKIDLIGRDTDGSSIKRSYNPMRRVVITKKEYKELAGSIDRERSGLGDKIDQPGRFTSAQVLAWLVIIIGAGVLGIILSR